MNELEKLEQFVEPNKIQLEQQTIVKQESWLEHRSQRGRAVQKRTLKMNMLELGGTFMIWESAKKSGEILWVELGWVQITFLINSRNDILAIYWRLTLNLIFVFEYGENFVSYWKDVCCQEWPLWEHLSTQLHTEEETLLIIIQPNCSLLTGSMKTKKWFYFTDAFDRCRGLWTDFIRCSGNKSKFSYHEFMEFLFNSKVKLTRLFLLKNANINTSA